MRQGRKFRILAKLRGVDTVQVAERVIAFINAESPDAIVVDGDGLGGGVVDQLRYRGYRNGLHKFHGGGRAFDADAYFNRRAEVWSLMGRWFKDGAEIPDDPELEVDLCNCQYGYSSKSQIQLERKSDMKARGLASPDLADTLAMSFAVTVQRQEPRPPDPETARLKRLLSDGMHHWI